MLYTKNEIIPYLPILAEKYIEAFRGSPWYELSKCVDRQSPQRCNNAMSAQEIGSLCSTCSSCPAQPAYRIDELVEKFEELNETKRSTWWVERTDGQISLAALAWVASADVIAAEKYPDSPDMSVWLRSTLGTNDFIWLDEVFADKRVKSQGNLVKFSEMTQSMADSLEGDSVAYRTITAQMIAAPIRSFGKRARVYSPERNEVPDNRSFVTLDMKGLSL